MNAIHVECERNSKISVDCPAPHNENAILVRYVYILPSGRNLKVLANGRSDIDFTFHSNASSTVNRLLGNYYLSNIHLNTPSQVSLSKSGLLS